VIETEVKHPLVRDLERVVCWVNVWADEPKAGDASKEFRAGYHKAILDVLTRLMPLAPDWLDTWRDRDERARRRSA
jgi:hypothetical protein